MAYLTAAEAQERIGLTLLKSLTNDSDPTSINSVVLSTIIDDAGSLIDSYLRQAYRDQLPFASPTQAIKSLTARILLFYLYSRRGDAPDHVKMAYDDSIRLLKEMGKDRFVEPAENMDDTLAVAVEGDEDDEEWWEEETFTIGNILTP